jgi:hypothetical protein
MKINTALCDICGKHGDLVPAIGQYYSATLRAWVDACAVCMHSMRTFGFNIVEYDMPGDVDVKLFWEHFRSVLEGKEGRHTV